MGEPRICFGQQPCGFFPKRYLVAKIATAREMQRNLGGKVIYFCHDSDHDYRETTTAMRDRDTGALKRINFDHVNKIQKKYTPLYLKEIHPDWQERTARLLPCFVAPPLVEVFRRVEATTVADFCLEMYRGLGLLEGIEVIRSSDPELRRHAAKVEDYYLDVPYEGETVRARFRNGRLWLHRGGDQYLEVPSQKPAPDKMSPARDTRLLWMQSIVRCTHYVAGAGEARYLNQAETPEVIFRARESIDRPGEAFVDFSIVEPDRLSRPAAR